LIEMPEPLIPTTHPVGWRRVARRVGTAALRASLSVSPRPMALFFRRQLSRTSRDRAQSLLARAPNDVVDVSIDERYGKHRDALLDVYVPASVAKANGNGPPLPTIVWTHGGAWVGGSKEELRGYFELIAGSGFTVVGIRYALAPEERYPTPVRQLMAALDHVTGNAKRLHVDPTRLVLAGDSAGSQISAQLAAIVTNPRYAQHIGIRPTIASRSLRGLALCCGIFDLVGLADGTSLESFSKTIGWAYSGTRDYRHNRHFMATTAVARYVNATYPPTFLTVGNADPLAPQSVALASALRSKRVPVETLFYPPHHQPALGHEYQFDLDLPDARTALYRLTAFCERCTK
jgi:acetyl esterase/lipase